MKVGGEKMSQFWKLAIICSVGSICVVLGVILNLPVAMQLALLVVGLVLSIWGLVSIIRYMLAENKKDDV